MIEHLNESQLIKGLRFLFRKAEEAGITFEGSAHQGGAGGCRGCQWRVVRPSCLAGAAYWPLTRCSVVNADRHVPSTLKG